jgi:Txe/YoeB family toxin of Txe-Axe toxin-antitoxin module
MRSETERKKMDNKYNGWANYETWNFKLWLDNDEASYKRIQELVKSCNNDHINLAYKLTDLAHKEAPEIQGFYSDVMMASVREVNYLEVARSLLED